MKKLLFVFLTGLFISGCGATAKDSEFWQHDSMYRNWEHTKFSIWGYRDCSPEDAIKAEEQDWWGVTPEECLVK